MHELSIAQALVEQVTAIAAREGATGVTEVTVAAGALSGVDPEALEMAFPLAAEGTCCAQARLTVRPVEARVYCRTCAKEAAADFPFGTCAECGGSAVEARSGGELILEALELGGAD